MKINNQFQALRNELTFPLEQTSLKSLVKPGDALTPNEVMNSVKMGFDMREIYVDESIHEFVNLDRLDKLQFIRERNKELDSIRRTHLRQQEEQFQSQIKAKREQEIEAEIAKRTAPPKTE